MLSEIPAERGWLACMTHTSIRALYLLFISLLMCRASWWKGDCSPTIISVRHFNFLKLSLISCRWWIACKKRITFLLCLSSRLCITTQTKPQDQETTLAQTSFEELNNKMHKRLKRLVVAWEVLSNPDKLTLRYVIKTSVPSRQAARTSCQDEQYRNINPKLLHRFWCLWQLDDNKILQQIPDTDRKFARNSPDWSSAVEVSPSQTQSCRRSREGWSWPYYRAIPSTTVFGKEATPGWVLKLDPNISTANKKENRHPSA